MIFARLFCARTARRITGRFALYSKIIVNEPRRHVFSVAPGRSGGRACRAVETALHAPRRNRSPELATYRHELISKNSANYGLHPTLAGFRTIRYRDPRATIRYEYFFFFSVAIIIITCYCCSNAIVGRYGSRNV